MTVRNSETDQAYYARRAREERERAAECDDRAAAFVHATLANAYDLKALGQQVPTHIVGN